MARSQRLRLSDIRAVYHLLGECRELGDDALSWNRHASEGLANLLMAQVSSAGEGESLYRPVVLADRGWTSPAARSKFVEYMVTGAWRVSPFHTRFVKLGLDITRSRDQLVQDREWFTCNEFNEFFKSSDLKETLFSAQGISNGLVHFLFLSRTLRDRTFERRQRSLVRLFHSEVGPQVGFALADSAGPPLSGLAPRLKETLDCLLEGDSEKLVALRLDLSAQTVHDYVKKLYRHFRVSSRSELLAYFLRRSRGKPSE